MNNPGEESWIERAKEGQTRVESHAAMDADGSETTSFACVDGGGWDDEVQLIRRVERRAAIR
jgi:hypothetical protein